MVWIHEEATKEEAGGEHAGRAKEFVEEPPAEAQRDVEAERAPVQVVLELPLAARPLLRRVPALHAAGEGGAAAAASGVSAQEAPTPMNE